MNEQPRLDPGDVFSFVLGFKNPTNVAEQEERERKYTEIAARVSLMAEHEGFKDLMNEITKFEEFFSLKPEFYSADPILAHKHTGALQALRFVKDWVEHCQAYIKQKEYEQANK